jgi:DUF971 family protein
MDSSQPVGLSLRAGKLVIEWSDGRLLEYAPAELRAACPCATCASGPPESRNPPTDLSLTAMQPVGNYAYRIEFSDGHATGIFPLDLLRRLGVETH